MKLLSLLTMVGFLTACSNPSQKEKRAQLAGMYKLFIMGNQDSTALE